MIINKKLAKTGGEIKMAAENVQPKSDPISSAGIGKKQHVTVKRQTNNAASMAWHK